MPPQGRKYLASSEASNRLFGAMGQAEKPWPFVSPEQWGPPKVCLLLIRLVLSLSGSKLYRQRSYINQYIKNIWLEPSSAPCRRRTPLISSAFIKLASCFPLSFFIFVFLSLTSIQTYQRRRVTEQGKRISPCLPLQNDQWVSIEFLMYASKMH